MSFLALVYSFLLRVPGREHSQLTPLELAIVAASGDGMNVERLMREPSVRAQAEEIEAKLGMLGYCARPRVSFGRTALFVVCLSVGAAVSSAAASLVTTRPS